MSTRILSDDSRRPPGEPADLQGARPDATSEPIKVESVVPKKRQDLLRWNGWGYKDSGFIVRDGVIEFAGNRYSIGAMKLPFFTEWVKKKFNVIVKDSPPMQRAPPEEVFPKPMMSDELLGDLRALGVSLSSEGMDRLYRSHGQTLFDIDVLRKRSFVRIPDVVVWPTCHDHVVKIVELADRKGMVIIPYGGGTSVSGAIECPPDERRPIVSLDTSQMNSILWVDRENLVVCAEAGIVGQDFERELRKLGYTVGHEPDSFEFSSLGGWVATRASGMKKNTYGNIEDLLVHARLVTPRGVLEKGCRVPRMSCGPDFQQLILGSEGCLGVVTEVVVKIRPLPECLRYGSLVFPSFEEGVGCLREVAKRRCQPSSIRLMDNEQFQFGQALRPVPSYLGYLLEGLKHAYISKIRGFDFSKMCVVTLLFEGDEETVTAHERKINAIAAQFGGIPAGKTNGERGYLLTYIIAYIRDLGYDYSIVAESFETSVPWDRTIALCRNTKHCVARECEKNNIRYFMLSYRVTQTYDAGCCVYFYFGFKFDDDVTDAIEIYEAIEEKARDEIIACGGSISHHHGVGKLRRKWYKQTVSRPGVNLFRATKLELDPNNVFGNGNLIGDIKQSKL